MNDDLVAIEEFQGFIEKSLLIPKDYDLSRLFARSIFGEKETISREVFQKFKKIVAHKKKISIKIVTDDTGIVSPKVIDLLVSSSDPRVIDVPEKLYGDENPLRNSFILTERYCSIFALEKIVENLESSEHQGNYTKRSVLGLLDQHRFSNLPLPYWRYVLNNVLCRTECGLYEKSSVDGLITKMDGFSAVNFERVAEEISEISWKRWQKPTVEGIHEILGRYQNEDARNISDDFFPIYLFRGATPLFFEKKVAEIIKDMRDFGEEKYPVMKRYLLRYVGGTRDSDCQSMQIQINGKVHEIRKDGVYEIQELGELFESIPPLKDRKTRDCLIANNFISKDSEGKLKGESLICAIAMLMDNYVAAERRDRICEATGLKPIAVTKRIADAVKNGKIKGAYDLRGKTATAPLMIYPIAQEDSLIQAVKNSQT